MPHFIGSGLGLGFKGTRKRPFLLMVYYSCDPCVLPCVPCGEKKHHKEHREVHKDHKSFNIHINYF